MSNRKIVFTTIILALAAGFLGGASAYNFSSNEKNDFLNMNYSYQLNRTVDTHKEKV